MRAHLRFEESVRFLAGSATTSSAGDERPLMDSHGHARIRARRIQMANG